MERGQSKTTLTENKMAKARFLSEAGLRHLER